MEPDQLCEFAQGLLKLDVSDVIIALSASTIVHLVVWQAVLRHPFDQVKRRVCMSAEILRTRMLTSQVPSGELLAAALRQQSSTHINISYQPCQKTFAGVA